MNNWYEDGYKGNTVHSITAHGIFDQLMFGHRVEILESDYGNEYGRNALLIFLPDVVMDQYRKLSVN